LADVFFWAIVLDYFRLAFGQIRYLNVNNISGALRMYEGWNFNSGNYLFTTDTK